MPLPEEKLRQAKLLRIGELSPTDPDASDVTSLDQLEFRAWCNISLSALINKRLATRSEEEEWKASHPNRWSENPYARARGLKTPASVELLSEAFQDLCDTDASA